MAMEKMKEKIHHDVAAAAGDVDGLEEVDEMKKDGAYIGMGHWSDNGWALTALSGGGG
jgi:hypothetical protein